MNEARKKRKFVKKLHKKIKKDFAKIEKARARFKADFPNASYIEMQQINNDCIKNGHEIIYSQAEMDKQKESEVK